MKKYKIALGLEYDGSQFQGWQRQKQEGNLSIPNTVQATLESALSLVANEPIETFCAGRTDAGVHASAQVVHFETSSERSEHAWVCGVNTSLPRTLRVLWAQAVDPDFDARKKAIARHYRYFIYNHTIRPSLFREYLSWHYKPLDIQPMQAASQYWLGEQDFSSFRASSCNSLSPYREMKEIRIQRLQDFVMIDFKANAFLQHMVRNMVGVLMVIGAGEAPIDWAKTVLAARDRQAAGLCAPPQGLYLVDVDYPSQYQFPKREIGAPFPFFPLLNPNLSQEALII